jgi:hypothetical protein
MVLKMVSDLQRTGSMERISSRIWVLALGVAVALGIVMAAFFLRGDNTSFLSPGQKRAESKATAKVLLNEAVKRVEQVIPRVF